VTTGGDEGDEGWFEGGIGEVSSGDVTLEVVHGDQREPLREGEAFGGRDPDEEGADQTRTHRDGDAGYVVEGCSRVGERLLYDAIEAFEVGAGGDLGHHAAVALVLRLCVDDVGENAATREVEDGGASVVAGGFDG
jgi:hypothetical protein